MIGARRILVLAAALAVTGGVSLAAGPDPEPPDTGRSGGQQPVQAVDADQAANYAVLRRPTTAQDRLRDQAAEFVEVMLTSENGAAAGLARRAQVTAGSAAVYVIPGRGYVCAYATTLGTDEGNAGCNRTEEALRGNVMVVEWPRPGVTRVAGLVIDGVSEVRLRDRSGGVESVTPVDNTYVFETAGEPVRVEWGDHVLPVPAGLKD